MQDRKLYYFSQSGHRHIRWPALLPQSACPNSDSYLHVNFISLLIRPFFSLYLHSICPDSGLFTEHWRAKPDLASGRRGRVFGSRRLDWQKALGIQRFQGFFLSYFSLPFQRALRCRRLSAVPRDPRTLRLLRSAGCGCRPPRSLRSAELRSGLGLPR